MWFQHGSGGGLILAQQKKKKKTNITQPSLAVVICFKVTFSFKGDCWQSCCQGSEYNVCVFTAVVAAISLKLHKGELQEDLHVDTSHCHKIEDLTAFWGGVAGWGLL